MELLGRECGQGLWGKPRVGIWGGLGRHRKGWDVGAEVSGGELAKIVCRQTEPTGAPGTCRHAKSLTQSQDCSQAQTPGHPLRRCPSPQVRVPSQPHIPGSRLLPPRTSISLPSAAHAHPTSRGPTTPPPSPSQPPGSASQRSCSVLTLPLLAVHPLASLALEKFASISGFLSAGCSSLCRLYFTHSLSTPFHLSVLTWVEDPEHHSGPIAHTQRQGVEGVVFLLVPVLLVV